MPRRPVVRPALVLAALLAGVSAGEPPLPKSPGHHRCAMTATVRVPGARPGEAERELAIEVPYLLYLPRAHFTDGNCPVLVFLHGAGERGHNLDAVFGHGPDGELRNRPELRAVYPFVSISPQCAPQRSWTDQVQSQAVVACIDHVLARFAVDRDRVYLTGVSQGGTGVWSVATLAPDRFAAIAPFSGRAWDPEASARRLRQIPTWIGAGGNDGDFTTGARQMGTAFAANGNTVRLAVVPGANHFVFTPYFDNPTFYAWFLAYRRGAAHDAKPDAITQARIDALLAAGRKLPRSEADAATPAGRSAGVTLPAERLTIGGLRAQLFAGTAFEQPLGERVDAAFDWPTGDFKLPGDRREQLSIRWSGLLRVDQPGLYTFHATADDGQRLRIGGLTLIDDWTMHGAQPESASVELTPGWHAIAIEYMQGAGPACYQLAWQGPGFARQALPAQQLAVERAAKPADR